MPFHPSKSQSVYPLKEKESLGVPLQMLVSSHGRLAVLSEEARKSASLGLETPQRRHPDLLPHHPSTNIAFAILFWIIHAHSKPIKPSFNNIPLWGLFISSSNVISFLTTKGPTHDVLIEAYGVVAYLTFSLSITLAVLSTKYSHNIPQGFRGLGWAVIIIFNSVTVVLGVYVMMFISVAV
ncbi:hypothetical protein QJS10_CPB11g01615 [Acorus calamus]|uniref:Uncharacterized protein n=1 Tax=Acorus calamus TaxID=4465 RepID=A0AAV9DXR5_ACOCL|nr:hypothetical protein QJS10_CPB11g01615 [Acorus calamus]